MAYNKETKMYEGYLYIILNDIYPDKVYIGQTIQTIDTRWRGHKTQIKNHISTDKLHNLMCKYGASHFGMEALEKCVSGTKEDLILRLNEKEKYYIAKFDSYYNGLNSTRGGRDCMDQKMKAVIKYSLYGEKISEYESVQDLRKEFDSVSTIYDCCLGSTKYAYGYIWRYKEDNILKYPLPNNAEIKEAMTRIYTNSLIDKYDYKGNKICTYKNVKEAAEYEHSTKTKIYKCCIGEHICFNIFIFRFHCDPFNKYKTYSDNPKIVEKYDLNNNFLEAYYGVREAGRKNNIAYQTIVAVCTGYHGKTAGGYIWKYANNLDQYNNAS